MDSTDTRHEYGAGSEELLERVRAERPDLIVVTGDLIDQKSQLEMVPALARGLAAIAPSYYVSRRGGCARARQV